MKNSSQEVLILTTDLVKSEGEKIKTRLMKDIVRVLSKDGEIHFVLREHIIDARRECIRYIKDAEIVALFKKEASKPLLLLRAE